MLVHFPRMLIFYCILVGCFLYGTGATQTKPVINTDPTVGFYRLRLSCTFDKQTNKTDIKWYVNNTKVIGNTTYTIQDYVLQFSVARNDNSYTCETSDGSTITEQIDIFILKPKTPVTVTSTTTKTPQVTVPPQVTVTPPECTFMSLGFNLQVVIIVVSGVVICFLVLSVAMVVIRGCPNSTRDIREPPKRTEETQKKRKRRLTRIRSVLEDGTVVYDEIDDKKWTTAGKKTAVTRDRTQAYEDVAGKCQGESYEQLQKISRISKLFFRKKSSKKAQTMETLKTHTNSATRENFYSNHTDSLTSSVMDNPGMEIGPSCSKNYYDSLPPRYDSTTYSDAVSHVHVPPRPKRTKSPENSQPDEYITMANKEGEKDDDDDTEDTPDYINLRTM